MKFLDLPARTCNELAKMPVEELERLPEVLSVIEKESLLEAVIISCPEFLRCALECLDMTIDMAAKPVKQQVFEVAAMYILGDNDPEERRIANEHDLYLPKTALRSF